MSTDNKRFVVKNGLQSQNIEFLSPDKNKSIDVTMLDSGSITFNGESIQLVSITDTTNGSIFSVNDISGIPSLDIDFDGTIKLGQSVGNILIGTDQDDDEYKLQVDGGIRTDELKLNGPLIADDEIGTDGQVLTSDGQKAIWTTLTKPQIENVLYVSKNGNDNNSGKNIDESLLTIEAALLLATNGTTIFIKSGQYTVTNPVTIPSGVSLIGDNLRTVSIKPSNVYQDIFYVNNGCYISGVTFRDHIAGAAAVSFNPDGSAGTISISPYIQNCSSITTTGIGMKVDGSVVSGLKSMVSDAYTQINSGGIGVYLLNKGYAQLVSIFTVACDIGFLAESGGTCSLINSNCSFGNIGLKATGTSDVLYSGITSNTTPLRSTTVVISNLTERPKYNDAIKFDGDSKYYTVAFATELDNGTSTITLEGGVETEIPIGTDVDFFQRSLITASSITFEYVGAGTDLFNTPRSGAFPNQENEVIEDADGAGKVNFTSTDHKGDFRIGNDLIINRETGTIQGVTFDRSLFAVLTPYILALEG